MLWLIGILALLLWAGSNLLLKAMRFRVLDGSFPYIVIGVGLSCFAAAFWLACVISFVCLDAYRLWGFIH